MKRRFKETLAFTLAFSMIFSSSQLTALAAEETFEEQEELEILEEQESEEYEEEQEFLDEILLEEEETQDESLFPEEEDEIVLTDAGESTPKDKLTMMVYGIGSDLEREGFAYTIDMCEMLAGMDAALIKAGDEDLADLPINLIVETGGVSYNKLMGDDRTEADKANLRVKTGKEILNDANAFNRYNQDLKALTGVDTLNFHSLFKVLTTSAYNDTASDKTEIYEAIDWSKNQRWNLIPDIKDSSFARIEPAKTPVSTRNENVSMVETDSNGVVKELFDFVDTTMQDYPAEQYVLVLWDHGGGPVDGFGSDERDLEVDSNGNRISSVLHGITGVDISKTMAALKAKKGAAWQNFAFAGYDACLMGSLDDISGWSGYSRYMIASEDLEGHDGWYYTPWMYDLTAAALNKTEDPFATTEAMDALTETTGKKVVDSFKEWFNDGKGTLALYDIRNNEAHTVEDAMDSLSDALVEYIRYNPADAFRSFYNANKNSYMFGGNLRGTPDINTFCEMLKEELPKAESRTVEEQAIYETADLLQTSLDDLIKYYQNTGQYKDSDKMKGVTLFNPYISAADGWKYWSIINAGTGTRQGYRDLIATYAAMQETGKVLREIYENVDNKYPTEEAALDAIENSFDEKLKEFSISEYAESTIDEVAYQLYEERITKKDTTVAKRGDNYYSNNDHWELVDELYQHARLQFDLMAESVENIYLGYLSDGDFDEGSYKLSRFGKDLQWFYLSDAGKTYAYPLNVIDELGDDPFTGKTEIQVPAYLLSTNGLDDTPGEYMPIDQIVLDLVFEEGAATGEVYGYYIVDDNGLSGTSRYVDNSKFTEYQYIVPTYDYAEKLLGDSYGSMEFKDAAGKFLLTKTPLKTAAFGRGVISEASIQAMAAELTNWAYESTKTLGEAKGSIKADYFIRDMFQREYYLDEDFTDEPSASSKATIMFYGVGSDLERRTYATSYDLTEIIAGLTAAKNALGVENLPVNVVADLGGMSFEPTKAEIKEGITRENKQKDRKEIRVSIAREDNEFAQYNKIMASLGDDKTDSYDIFCNLTPTVSDGEVTSDEVIDWEKNQRWELLPMTVGDDNLSFCLAVARNAYEQNDANRERPMTLADEAGVTLELYDFVKTTMEQYPSEQYILILWDHGGGETMGFGSDERGGDTISSYNVRKTFDALKNDVQNWQSLSFIGYDACLMSTIQTAKAWQGTAEYMLASEALEPGDGWNYVRWINKLCTEAADDKNDAFGKSSTMAPVTEELGKIIVDDYVDWYLQDSRYDMGTMALINLDRDGLNNLSRATEGFGEALNDYIVDRPVDAYSEIFDIRKDTVDFGTQADIRHLAYNADNRLYAAAYASETPDPVIKKVVDAAENLIKASDSGLPVVYRKNTGYFEDWTAEGNTRLGGMALEFPNDDNADTYWEAYLKQYKQIEPDTDPWRDFLGSFVAIHNSGDVMKKVYLETYADKAAAVTAIQNSLNESLNKYSVTASYASALKSAVPEQLYENRIVRDDVQVVPINEDYYLMPRTTNNKLVDSLNQHGYISMKSTVLGLGVIPGSELDSTLDDNGIRIPNYGKDNWIWMESQDGSVIYPASVYDTFYRDTAGNTMGDSLFVSVPAVTFSASKNAKGETEYNRNGMVYLNVFFKDGNKKAEIESFKDIDTNAAHANTRIKEVQDLKDLYILPLYNVYENLIEHDDSEFSYPVGGAVKPIAAADLIISRGAENDGLKIFAEGDKTLTEDNLYITTNYYLTDKFAKNYELHEMKYRSFGLRWKNTGAAGNGIWLPEGTVIKKTDLTPVVSINGQDDSESTEQFGANILANAKIEVAGEQIALSDEGYTLGAVSYVDIVLNEEDLTPEKMVPGYAALEESEKADIRNSWNNEFINVWNRGRIRINVVGTNVTEDDQRSGMDPEITAIPTGDNEYSLTMVKGQTITLGKGDWKSDNTEYVTVAKKTGKVKAKKVTPVATTEEQKDIVVAVTNSAVSPAVTYVITVVAPAIYEVTDNDGKTTYSAAKTITLSTVTGNLEPSRVRLSLLSSVVKDGTPDSVVFNVAWVSSNPKVAAVYADEEDGSTSCYVEAVAKGSAKISAWVNGKAYSCNIKVTDVLGKKTAYGVPDTFGLNVDADGTLLETGSVCVNSGSTTALKYAAKSGFVPKSATWTYVNGNGEEIKAEDAPAYVNKSGKLIAVRQGSISVKGAYTAKGKTVNAEFDVYVVPVPTKRATYLLQGKTETLKFYKVKNAKAEWKSSDEAVAKVDSKGKVTAVAGGEADITCSYNGSEYKTTVYVEVPTLDTSDARIKAGTKANTYTLTLKKGTRFLIRAPYVYQKLNWKSSKAACAFVNENDIIEGRKAGKSNVTTKINGVTVKIEVIIQD